LLKEKEMQRVMSKDWLKKHLTGVKCVVCGRHYSPTDIKVLGRGDDLWLINLHCSHCGTEGMGIVSALKPSTFMPVTDLGPEEFEKFAKQPPISADDVIDTYQFLANFDGDFKKLFEKEGIN